MIKSLFLLVFFVAVSSVAFGQTQQNITSTGDNVTVTEYDKAPKQVKDKTTTSGSTSTSTSTTGSDSNSKTSKSYGKGCCGMNGAKHACCAGMSGKKKMKKKKASTL